MSACISMHGEYSEHTLGEDFLCTLCFVLDEVALIADRDQYKARAKELEAERDRARDLAVALEQEIGAVLALHAPFNIYDECGHHHDYDEDGNVPEGVIEVEEVGLTCEAGRLYTICSECCATDDPWSYQTEECADGHNHSEDRPLCGTVARLRNVALRTDRHLVDGAP